MVVDVIQLNVTEWYHNLPLHDYLDYLKFRFANRKTRWKGNEGFVNTKIAPSLTSIDQLCFSSQHYFVNCLYVGGMSQVIIGMQTLLYVENYNCFSDMATIPVSMVILLFCIITH